MALSKKKVSFDIGSQISAMNGEGQMIERLSMKIGLWSEIYGK